MAKHDAQNEAEKTKPAASRGGPPPVIRRLEVAEEDSTERLLRRQVPAWVISGLVHVVLITGFILLNEFVFKQEAEKDKQLKAATTNTKMDDPPPPPDDNLTNIDPGLDSELQAAVENVEIEKEFNVEAPPVDGEPSGLPTENSEFIPPVTSQIGSLTDTLAAPGAIGQATDSGVIAIGQAGRGGDLAMPGLNGRSGATKDKLLKSGGGNKDSERAVAMGLAWIAKQQNKGTGYWEFDGGHKNDRIAATGLAILPFLAAGETHMSGKEPKYRDTVRLGLYYLKKELKPNGQFGSSGMYSQPIATIALCEAAGMTQDKGMLNDAKRAVDFIVKAQGGNGSWGYTAGTEGDTSIVGWNIQALKSARLAGISVPDKAFKQAEAFLNSVSNDSGASYGYRGPGASHTLSSVGLLCRQYMGWNPRNPSLGRGVNNLVGKFPPQKNDFNMYYYYYATQVVHFFGGPDWEIKWNPVMRDMLIGLQLTEKTPNVKAADIGSWQKDNHFIGSECGKLGTTCLCVLTLEVYYRHLPLYKRDAGGGLQELERGN